MKRILFGLFALAVTLCTAQTVTDRRTITRGQRAELSVVATGTQPFVFLWYKDGEPITDSESAKLIVTEPGAYKVKVANGAGAAISNTVTIIVIEPTPTPTPLPTATPTPTPSPTPTPAPTATPTPTPAVTAPKNPILRTKVL